LFNARGNKVAAIFHGTQSAGPRLIAWRPITGKTASGIYFIKLSIGKESGTQKVIIYQ
jgi:hypothetical protein